MPVLRDPACLGTGLIAGTLGSVPGSAALADNLLATVCSATGAKTPVVFLLYESFSVHLGTSTPERWRENDSLLVKALPTTWTLSRSSSFVNSF